MSNPDVGTLTVFALRLREARLAHGYRKQGDLQRALLAHGVEVTASAVSNWETARALPQTHILVVLARTLSLSTDYLLGLSDGGVFISQETSDAIDALVKLRNPAPVQVRSEKEREKIAAMLEELVRL